MILAKYTYQLKKNNKLPINNILFYILNKYYCEFQKYCIKESMKN